MNIGSNIKKLRRERDMTQEQLAAAENRHGIHLIFIASASEHFHGFAPVDKITALAHGGYPHTVFPDSGDQLELSVSMIPEHKIMGIRWLFRG